MTAILELRSGDSRARVAPALGGRITAAELAHPDGSPPYTVRWLNDDHESVVFPGPDARVEAAGSAGSQT